jgi:hypothetical protein
VEATGFVRRPPWGLLICLMADLLASLHLAQNLFRKLRSFFERKKAEVCLKSKKTEKCINLLWNPQTTLF